MTSERKHALIWGGLLIIFGAAALIDNLLDPGVWLWTGTLGVVGLGSLFVYLTDPSEGWPLIPAYAGLALAGFITAIELELLTGPWIAPTILSLVGIPFLAIYLSDRSQWWALIPSYVLFSVALLVGLEESAALGGAWVGPYVLAAVAFPFLIVFLVNRRQWWALIPAYILLATGLMIALISGGILRNGFIPAYILFSVALPFFVVYLVDRRQWWALIPAGINGVIGLSILLAEESLFQYVVPVVLILAGLALLLRVFSRGAAGDDDARADKLEA